MARTAARRKPARRLWGEDKGGRFRTRGRNSVATVRGTRWLTEDTCAGTRTRVLEGAVDVFDPARGITRRVVAGASLLVRPAGR
jgi:ferric-dicitrate binding protein FerR (iron transport regulator)